jgi:hypothetical protein
MKSRLFIWLLIFALPLSAQQSDPEKKPKRTCRIIYTNKPVGAPQEAYLFDGVKSQKVLLPTMNLSEVIELPMGDISLGLVDREINDPVLFPKGAPSVKIPGNYKDIYLFLSVDNSNKVLPIKIKVVNVDKDKLRIGHTLWFNMSDHNIGAILGSQKVVLPANKVTISAPPIGESGFYAAQFNYQKNGQGDFRPVMNKSWWHDNTSRHIGFIFDTGAKMPKIITIRDRRAK